MDLLQVSLAVAFCAALIGGGAVGAGAEIAASVPAGVHWRTLGNTQDITDLAWLWGV